LTRSGPFALLLSLLLADKVLAETREIWYNITYATANPDGQFERQVIGINGTWP
jgi:iron transport multicopper oxidase